MKNITSGQWLGIIIVVVSVLSTSTTNLTDIFGSEAAKIITSAASLVTAILGGVVTMLTRQTGMIQQVKSFDGVEAIQINDKAPKAIVDATADPNEDTIEPAPGMEAAVAKKRTGI